MMPTPIARPIERDVVLMRTTMIMIIIIIIIKS